MTEKFRIFRRASGRWYIENTITRRQESLHTSDAAEAKRLLMANNEAHHQPAINMQIARGHHREQRPVDHRLVPNDFRVLCLIPTFFIVQGFAHRHSQMQC